jgi:hypothetical protein
MRYKFEQFNIEIENPTVEIDLKTIRDNAIDKLLSVDVILTVNGLRFGVTAENMAYVDSWEDSEIEEMVTEWLKQFEV